MRRILLSLLFIMALSVFSGMSQTTIGGGYGTGGNLSVLVTGKPVDDLEPKNPVKGDRKPSRKLMAQIGAGWVMIEGVDVSEIVLFEINETNGFPVGYFDSASEFTEILFSLQGEYEVRFITEEWEYVGYVWIE